MRRKEDSSLSLRSAYIIVIFDLMACLKQLITMQTDVLHRPSSEGNRLEQLKTQLLYFAVLSR